MNTIAEIGDNLKKNIRRFFRRFVGRYLHIHILVVLLSYVAWRFVLSGNDSIQNDQYILSAISQSLAAWFVLILAFTVLVLESGHKYKGLIGEFFRIWINPLHAIVHVVGIIVPLIILKRGISHCWTSFAIGIAVFCLLFSVSYFLRMKLFIKYNIGIRHDAEQARRVISQSDKCEYAQILKSVYKLCQESANIGNPGAIVVGFKEISDLVYYVYNKIKADDDSVKNTIKCLTDLILAASREKNVKYISREIFSMLPTRLQLLDLKNNVYFNVTKTLFEVGNKTSNKRVKKNMYSSIWLIIAKGKWQKKEFDELKKRLKINLTDKTNIEIFMQCSDPDFYKKDIVGENVYSVNLENAEKSVILKLRKYLNKYFAKQ